MVGTECIRQPSSSFFPKMGHWSFWGKNVSGQITTAESNVVTPGFWKIQGTEKTRIKSAILIVRGADGVSLYTLKITHSKRNNFYFNLFFKYETDQPASLGEYTLEKKKKFCHTKFFELTKALFQFSAKSKKSDFHWQFIFKPLT